MSVLSFTGELMKHKKKRSIFIVSLDVGERILESLASFCEKNNILSGFFNGIGAVDRAELMHYSVKTKNIRQKYTKCHWRLSL
jgi:predicted DNA-binding protein with PD1-like motif